MRVSGISYVQGRNYSRDSSGKPIVTSKYGIAVHCTANDASAEAEADYATRRTDDVSSHFYVDSNSVVQSLDTGWRAWHAASSIGNSNSISVEITGFNGWSRSQWLARVAWDKLGRVLAAVIRSHWSDGSFRLRRASVSEMIDNPRVKAFYGHYDMTRAWGGSHTDPGPNFPWDRLFDTVRTALGGDDMNPHDVWSFTITSPGLGLSMPAWDWLKRGETAARGIEELKLGQQAILAAVSGSSAEAILAEIRAQGEQTRAALGEATDTILAALPEVAGPVSLEDLIAALTAVLGSVDGATPQDATPQTATPQTATIPDQQQRAQDQPAQ